MRVGYIAPMSIAAVKGGVRTQATKTIAHVRNFGVEPVNISPWETICKEDFDAVHIFGATIENVGIAALLQSQNIPMVLSPIFFSTRSAAFIRSALMVEQIMQKAGSGIRSDFSVKAQMCNQAALILPNTNEEASLIEKGFSIPSKKIKMVPNAVDTRFGDADPSTFIDKFGLQDFVLFVGQAGAPRKNVISLLKVAPKIDAPIVIIGSLYEDEYGKQCEALAEKAGNVTFIETQNHDSDLLKSAYAAAKVFVLPSLYETPGIAAMEAGIGGANVVITEKGGTKSYFGSHADYINPNSIESVLHAVESALQKPKSDQLKQHILANYTWAKVAEQTAELYKTLLS